METEGGYVVLLGADGGGRYCQIGSRRPLYPEMETFCISIGLVVLRVYGFMEVLCKLIEL